MEKQNTLDHGIFAIYDCTEKTIVCSLGLSKLLGGTGSGESLYELLERNSSMDEGLLDAYFGIR